MLQSAPNVTLYSCRTRNGFVFRLRNPPCPIVALLRQSPSHKIGIGNSRYVKGKQARLLNRRMLMDYFRLGDLAA